MQIKNGVFKTVPGLDVFFGAQTDAEYKRLTGRDPVKADTVGGRGDYLPPGAPPAPLPGRQGCNLAPDLVRMGCNTDECGRVYVRVRDRMIQVQSPESIRIRPLSGLMTFTTSVAATPASFGIEIAPDVPNFLPRRLIVETGFGGDPLLQSLTPDHIVIQSIKIGNREQFVGKVNGSVRGTITGSGLSTGVVASAFARNSQDTEFDFDLAQPSLGMTIDGVVYPVATAALAAYVSFTFWGLSFER